MEAPEETQRSVLEQLRGHPRAYVFMLGLALSTVAGVSITMWYTAYARQEFGSAGVGGIAMTYSLVLAVCAIPAGIVVDRFRASRVLPVTMAIMGVLAVLSGWLLAERTLSLPGLLAICACEAVVFSLLALAVVKVQASLVPASSRGSMSILHLAVVAVAGVVATFYASSRTGGPGDFWLVAGLDAAAALIYLGSTAAARTAEGHARRQLVGLRAAVAAIRADSALSAVLILDLVLTFALPTQAVNLYLADTMHEHLGPPLAMTGFIAAGLAGAVLLVRGLRPGLARSLCWTFVAYAAVVVASIPVTMAPTSPPRDVLLGGLVMVGIFAVVVGQGLVHALVQQRCPDEIRGRVTGTVSALRKLLVAAGVALATALSGVGNTAVMLAFYLVLIVLTLAWTRGFRTIADV